MSEILTFEDFFHYFKKFGGIEGINKLLYVDSSNVKAIFEGFLENTDFFLRTSSYHLRDLKDGGVETYFIDGGQIFPIQRFKNVTEVYLKIFEESVMEYNKAIEDIIKRPGPAAGKKFPELFTMKREPWGFS